MPRRSSAQPSPKDFISAMHQLAHDKNIEYELIIEMLKEAMKSAAKKYFGDKKEFDVEINDETGEIRIFSLKEVVENVTDPDTQISLEEAKEYDEEVEIGDTVKLEKDKDSMGRIAANAAKQVIMSKIKDFERFHIYNEFKERIGEVVNVPVRRFERGNVVVDLGKTEGVIRRDQLIPGERFSVGDRVRAVIVDVSRAGDLQVQLSRTDPRLLIKLFEMEVPEVYEGTVIIKNIVREPGERSKVAVYSTESDIDPIGACVGVGGSRIKAILRELKGEKVDIIKYEDDIERFAENALSPAKLLRVSIADRETKRLEVIVSDDQYSLAIGTHGQNVRLASKLVGWTIDVKREADKKEEIKRQMGGGSDEDEKNLSELKGIGKKKLEKLEEAGFVKIKDIAEASVDELSAVDGIGKKSAEQLIEQAKKALLGEDD